MSVDQVDATAGRTELRIEHNPRQTLVAFCREGEPTVDGVVAVQADGVPITDLSALAENIEETVMEWSR